MKLKQKHWAEESKAYDANVKKQQATMKGVLGSAGRTFGGLVSKGVGFASQVAQGAGVNFDVGSLVGKHVALEKQATDITSSGYLEGDKGAAGKRQDPKAVIAEARAAADAAAISTDTAMDGLQRFVGKSTDLETGRAILTSMAIQSKATASNMSDVMDAAGEVAVKLGDVPDKAKAVQSVMAVIAKQGKLGAVEMRSMASSIAVMIGPANKFAEGTEKAMNELGAAFQITKKFGGVKGPAQAATAVASFAADLTSKSGLKALQKSGIGLDTIFADKGHTKLNNLDKLLPALLNKSGGDLTNIAKEMPNKRSGAVLNAFAQIWNDAEKAKKGSGGEAVKKTFTEYGGEMSAKDTKDSLAAAMDTTESKVQLFNNQLERIASTSAEKLLPALEKLGPSLIRLAETVGDVATWVAENPKTAIAAALAASLAKAGLEAALSSGIAAILARVAGSSALGGVGGAGGAGALAGGALAGAAIGYGAVSTMYGKMEAGAEAATDASEKTGDVISKAMAEYKTSGSLSPETRKALGAQEKSNNDEIAKGNGTSTLANWMPWSMSDTTLAQVGEQDAAKMNTGTMLNQNKVIEGLLGATPAQLEAGAAKHAAAAAALTASAADIAAAARSLGASGGRPPTPGSTTPPAPARGG